MKTVTGKVISTKPISLSKAATLLSGFASSDNGANQAVSAYLQRASDAFNELKSIHREIKSSSRKAKPDPNPTREPEKLVGAKGVDNVSEKVSTFVQENEKKKKKAKSNQNPTREPEELVGAKGVDTVSEKVSTFDEKKKKKEKKVKEKLEDEQMKEERKKKKNKRKSDEEIGSEERKSKKRKKSKEIDV